MEYFFRPGPSPLTYSRVFKVCMHKCHTLFVSLAGNVWSCGLGQGGRLGHPVEETVLIPRKINLTGSPSSPPLFCIKAAIGQDHSIFLCNDNQVSLSVKRGCIWWAVVYGEYIFRIELRRY